MLLGSEIDRPAAVTGTAGADAGAAPADAMGTDPTGFDPSGDAADRRARRRGRALSGRDAQRRPDPDDEDPDGATPAAQTITVTLRQRPWLTRGLLTALILLAIIGLWAALFLFGLREVFTQDPATKTAPKSFFAGDGGSWPDPPRARQAAQVAPSAAAAPGARPRLIRPRPDPAADPAATARPAATGPAATRRAAQGRRHAARVGRHDRRHGARGEQR